MTPRNGPSSAPAEGGQDNSKYPELDEQERMKQTLIDAENQYSNAGIPRI